MSSPWEHIHTRLHHPPDVFHEQPPFCLPNISFEQLQVRIQFLNRQLNTYGQYADSMDAANTSCDPCKFRKLKQYNEMRLRETYRLLSSRGEHNLGNGGT